MSLQVNGTVVHYSILGDVDIDNTSNTITLMAENSEITLVDISPHSDIMIMLEVGVEYEIYTDTGAPITQEQLLLFLSKFNNTPIEHNISSVSTNTELEVRSLTQYTDQHINTTYKNMFIYDNDRRTSMNYTIGSDEQKVSDINSPFIDLSSKRVYNRDTGIWIVPIPETKFIGGSVGDPYVYYSRGLHNFRYKIPGKPCIYRLFGNTNITINTSVSGMSSSEQKKIQNTYKKHGISNSVLDGFYFDMFFVRYKDSYIIYDRYLMVKGMNITSHHSMNIHVDNTIRQRMLPLMGKQCYTTIDIVLGGGVMTVRLYKYLSPQVINGIELSIHTTYDSATGLLVDKEGYHPSSYKIKKLRNTLMLYKKKKDKLYKKQIVDMYQSLRINQKM